MKIIDQIGIAEKAVKRIVHFLFPSASPDLSAQLQAMHAAIAKIESMWQSKSPHDSPQLRTFQFLKELEGKFRMIQKTLEYNQLSLQVGSELAKSNLSATKELIAFLEKNQQGIKLVACRPQKKPAKILLKNWDIVLRKGNITEQMLDVAATEEIMAIWNFLFFKQKSKNLIEKIKTEIPAPLKRIPRNVKTAVA